MDEAKGKCREATEWLKSSVFGKFLMMFVCLFEKCFCCLILGVDDSSEETPRTVFKALKKTVI